MKRRLVLLLLLFWIPVACTNPYQESRIAQTAMINQEWSEIRPPHPLKWAKPVQEFSFHIDSPYHHTAQAQIVGADGQRFVPDVQFLTASGKVYIPDAHGFWGEDMYFFYSKGNNTTEPIVSIRVRSSLPLNISNLLWVGYDPAKVKR
jgi:hypothetical protein